MIGWNHGTIEPVEEMTLPVLDRGVQYGEGLYETMLVREETVPLLDRHLDRLRTSTERLDLPHPGDDTIRRVVTETIQANRTSDTALQNEEHFVLKLLLTGGPGNGLYRSNSPDPRLMILPRTFPDQIRSWKETGGIGEFVPARGNTGSDLGQVKSTSRLDEALALEQVHREDDEYREALFVNDAHRLLQGARSNIFVRTDGTWYTPPVSEGVLPGIARDILLERSEKGRVEEETLFTEDLLRADGIAVTNAVTGPIPLRKIVAPSLLAFEKTPLSYPVQNDVVLQNVWTQAINSL